jgi:hypothetical protein
VEATLSILVTLAALSVVQRNAVDCTLDAEKVASAAAVVVPLLGVRYAADAEGIVKEALDPSEVTVVLSMTGPIGSCAGSRPRFVPTTVTVTPYVNVFIAGVTEVMVIVTPASSTVAIVAVDVDCGLVEYVAASNTPDCHPSNVASTFTNGLLELDEAPNGR